MLGIGVGVSLVGKMRRCLLGGSHRTRAMEGLSLKEKTCKALTSLQKEFHTYWKDIFSYKNSTFTNYTVIQCTRFR